MKKKKTKIKVRKYTSLDWLAVARNTAQSLYKELLMLHLTALAEHREEDISSVDSKYLDELRWLLKALGDDEKYMQSESKVKVGGTD